MNSQLDRALRSAACKTLKVCTVKGEGANEASQLEENRIIVIC